METNDPYISVRNIWKSFPGVVALKNVSIDFHRGEVHALLGENGAGKSTLVKIISGIYVPDRGEVVIGGRRKALASPTDALKEGVVMVSQNPQLIESLTVAENLALSLNRYGSFARISSVDAFVSEASRRIGVKIDPKAEVWRLSYVEKQVVELVRAIMLGARVLILDEVLTFLPHSEKSKIYGFVRMFKKSGGSVILITHKIPEALEVSDRVTVMRKGEVIATLESSKASLDMLRKMMFGERGESSSAIDGRRSEKISNELLLEVEGLHVLNDHGFHAVKDLSFKLRRGEVLGIAGVAGNGQLELVQAIVGLRRVFRGRVLLHANGSVIDITNTDPGRIRSLGVGYIPDDPLKYGLSLENSVLENIAILPIFSKLLVDWKAARRVANDLVRRFSVATPSLDTRLKVLSGGNLAKILVARELHVASRLLIAYNPTRFLDEASSALVRGIIRRKAVEEGVSAIIVSEDLDEVLSISDSVAVISSGRLVGFFEGRADREQVEALIAG